MNQLTKVFEEQDLTIVEVEGDFHFLLKDVCEILEIGNHRHVKTRLEDDVVSNYPIQDRLGRNQNATFVNEDGLYDVILDSRKPEAKRFRKWITSEVLPSIRKHGAYMTPEKVQEAILNPDVMIQLATTLKKEQWARKKLERENTKLGTENAVLDQQNKELKPKATYYDLILQNKSLLSVTQIAKDYGMSAVALNKTLHKLGVQYKQGGVWLLYAKHQDCGYTQTHTHLIDAERSRITTKWTQKGRLFIYHLLKEHGVYPAIEKE